MRILLLIPFLLLSVLSGCARMHVNRPSNYRTVQTSAISDPTSARQKHEKALDLMADCRLTEAEQCLQEALIEDVSFGPAHNTLGKLYYDQKKFYLAAWEFEYALKTMPNRAEPLNNLGLVLESVGQIETAIGRYEQALEVSPENPQYLGNYLRARYRLTGFTEDLRSQLEDLIILDDRQDWVNWAKGLLSKNHPQERSITSDEEFEYRPLLEAPYFGDAMESKESQSFQPQALEPILVSPNGSAN